MFPRMDWYIGAAGAERIYLDRRAIHGAPEAMRGLRAVFATDFHLTAHASPRPVIDLIRGCGADLILLGGDFADKRDQALRLFEAFRTLRAPMGIFAAPGNNDVEAFGTLNELRGALDGCGVRLLVNESVQLAGFCVGGTDECKYATAGRGPENVFAGRDGWRVLISHYPVLHPSAPDLMLSGHTHGGQFNAFGLTPYGIGYECISRRQRPLAVSGMHEIGGTRLLVSRGLGASKIPLRVGVKPEIHLLEFEC